MREGPTAGRAALLARRVILRTEQTPLRSVWRLAYRAAAQAIARRLGGACPGAAVYAKGTLAAGRPVFGLSDIDLVLVAPDGDERGREAARGRWQRLAERRPALRGLVPHLWFYTEGELGDCLASPVLLHGLDAPPGASGAAFLGPAPPSDEMGVIERPGLDSPRESWRRLAGPERRPPASRPDPVRRCLLAWLELQEWWRYAFRACAGPGRAGDAYLCVKLVAEPVRILGWLEDGVLEHDRLRALRHAVERIPEEEESLRRAIALHRALPRSPEPPLVETLPVLARLSARIAERLAAGVAAAGSTPVRLAGGDLVLPEPPGPGAVPLADWRARAVPALPDEALDPLDGDPGDPAAIARAVRASRAWLHPALRAGSLLVLPTAHAWAWGRLRAAQCPLTDPVSFALLDGRAAASFPEAPGWSARDCARRAAAEHRAWLSEALRTTAIPPAWIEAPRSSSDPSAATLGMLFTAARAALFLQSVEREEPELALTVQATARLLGGELAADAAAAYRACRPARSAPDGRLVHAFRELVAGLPAYRDPAP